MKDVVLKSGVCPETFRNVLGMSASGNDLFFNELRENGGFIEDDDMFHNYLKLCSGDYDWAAPTEKIMSLVNLKK